MCIVVEGNRTAGPEDLKNQYVLSGRERQTLGGFTMPKLWFELEHKLGSELS
jgi:hypothetical protein